MSTEYSNILVHGNSNTTYNQDPKLSMNITVGSVTRNGTELSLTIESANLNGTNSTTYFGYDLNVYAKLGDGNLVQLFAKPNSDSQWNSTKYVVYNVSISEANNTTTSTTLSILVNATCGCSPDHPTVTMWSTTLVAPQYDASTPPTISLTNAGHNLTSVSFTYSITDNGKNSDGTTAYITSQVVTISGGGQSATFTPTTSSGTEVFVNLAPGTPYTLTYTVTNSGNKTKSVDFNQSTNSVTDPSISTTSFIFTPSNEDPSVESDFTGTWDYSTTGSTIGTFSCYLDVHVSNSGVPSSSDSSILGSNYSISSSSVKSFSLKQNPNDPSQIILTVDSQDTSYTYTFLENTYLYFMIAPQISYTDRWSVTHYYPSSLSFTNSNAIGPLQDQASVFVLVNGVWKKGKVFVKVNNNWKKAKKVYTKVGTDWKPQDNT